MDTLPPLEAWEEEVLGRRERLLMAVRECEAHDELEAVPALEYQLNGLKARLPSHCLRAGGQQGRY